jgi:hypothetical protein
MSDNNSVYARVFPVETNFQKMARRPGGISRERALRNAKTEVLRLFIRCNRPVREILKRVVPLTRSPRVGWLPTASRVKV